MYEEGREPVLECREIISMRLLLFVTVAERPSDMRFRDYEHWLRTSIVIHALETLDSSFVGSPRSLALTTTSTACVFTISRRPSKEIRRILLVLGSQLF